jgi:hypothetical protein
MSVAINQARRTRIAASNAAATMDDIQPGEVWETLTLIAICVHSVAVVVIKASAPSAAERM